MKYSITYKPHLNSTRYQSNLNCVEINVSTELTKPSRWFDSIICTEVSEKFYYKLLDITGVISVSVSKYQVNLTKGSLFEWEKITSEAIMLILLHYCPNEKAIEIAKPDVN